MAQRPTVIFVEVPGQKPLPHATALQVAAHGCDMLLLTGTEQGCHALQQKQANTVFAVISNAADAELFETSRRLQPDAVNILVTASTIHQYSRDLAQNDLHLIDHVIANLSDEWTIDELRTTLQKLIQQDLIGLEKYLVTSTPVHELTVKSSRDRESYNAEVQKWAEQCGVSRSISRSVYGITEELLMNAIYDAPVAGGRTHYEAMERTAARDLQTDEHAKLRYGCDGRFLALSIQDPFGAFKRQTWWQYTRKILRRNDVDTLIDKKKGGAGLGLFKMLYSSHGVVCNVIPGKITEVIVLIDLTQPVRDFDHMARSIHYFCAPAT